MSNIPGVTVTPKPVEVKSSAQSKTVWSTVIAAALLVISKFFPDANIDSYITEDTIEAVATIFGALAMIFLRKSVEDTKKAAAGAPVVKQ